MSIHPLSRFSAKHLHVTLSVTQLQRAVTRVDLHVLFAGVMFQAPPAIREEHPFPMSVSEKRDKAAHKRSVIRLGKST